MKLDPCPCGSEEEYFGNAPIAGQQTVFCSGCGKYKGVYVRRLREGEKAAPFRDPAPLQGAKGFRIGI